MHTALGDAPQTMASMPRGPWAWVDRFLAPQADRFGADELRRARLAVVLCALAALLAAVAATNLALHGVWGNVPVAGGCLGLFAVVPFVLRRTGSLALAGNAIAAVLAVGLFGLKLNTGAVSMPPFILLPGVPLLAALLAGPWSGLFWGVVALAELVFFYTLAINGLEPTIELDADHLFRGRYVGSAMMVVFVALLAQAYERLKNRALGELKLAQEVVEQRSRELDETRRQQLEMKDRFVSHVSHELRTPLAALHQFLSLVLDGVAGEVGEEQRDYLSIAFRNAEQLRHMIDDLMDLNRARDGKLRVESELFRLGPVLSDTARGLETRAGEKGIRLGASIPADLPLVQGDATRVRQVVGNLVENAIKFTGPEGSIDVTVAADPEDEAFLRISVRDTGCGMEPDALERVFERLHQEEAAEADSRLGLGLGLAIAKELVQRQGGRIWVESQIGVGSTFHFTLPIFSLPRALRPCLLSEGQLRGDFTVLSVDLRIEDGSSSDGLRRGIPHLLRSTVFFPEKDVVLPPGASGSPPDRFAVAVAAGAEGADALTERLRERLDRFAEERSQDRSTFQLNVKTERVPAELSRLPQDEALEILASRVEEILREPCMKEEEKRWTPQRS